MRNGGSRKTVVVVALAIGLTLAACGDDDGDAEASRASVPKATTTAEPTTSPTTAATTTTEPAPQFEPLVADPALTPEEQVEAAYLFYWEVVLDAFRRGDGSMLTLVLTGDALLHRQEELETLVDEGYRFGGTVEHNYAVTVLEGDQAVVADLETNRLTTVDAVSGETVVEPLDEELLYEYRMVKEDGQWRVASIVQHPPSS